MTLSQTKIFAFIEGVSDECEVVFFDKGDTISSSLADDKSVWYVVKGIVDVLANADGDRQVHVDYVGEDDFAGVVGHRFDHDFQFDLVAYTPCEALRIPANAFERLISESPDFERLYNDCCMQRAYGLFKRSLTTKLFSQRQLLAAHIVRNTKNSVFFLNIPEACSATDASKRNLYNHIYALVDSGAIIYKKPKTIFVKDEDALLGIARPVLALT